MRSPINANYSNADYRGFFRKFSRFVVAWRFLFLALAVASGLTAAWISKDFRLDRRLESMFPRDSKVLNDYQLLKESFGGNEVVLIVYSDDQFWSGSNESMERLRELGDKIRGSQGVRAVMDLSQIDKLVESAESGIAGLFSRRPKPNADGKVLTGIRGTTPLAVAMRQTFVGYTHSSTGGWLALAVILEPSETKQSNGAVIGALRNKARDHFKSDSNYYLVGEPVLVEEGFDLIENDGVRLGWTSAIALSLFLVLFLRTIRWTIATLAVVYWSLWMTRAICVVAGWQLTMVSSMLVAMVTVISIATCMHWFVAYQRSKNEEQNDRAIDVDSADPSKSSAAIESIPAKSNSIEALTVSLEELIAPIFWACATTAIAFMALMAAHVEPVRDYGLMMAVASVCVFVGILAIVPGIVLLGTPVRSSQINRTAQSARFVRLENRLGSFLRRFLELLLARPIWTWLFLAVWVLCTAIGTWRVEVETDFLKNFKSSSPLVQGYRVVEEHLGGAGVWDLIVPAPQVITREYLAEVAALDKKLSELSNVGLTKVISLAGAEAAARKSPILARLTPTLRLGAMRGAIPAFYDSLLTPVDIPQPIQSPRRLRIMLRAKENVSTDAKQTLIREVTQIVQSHTSTPNWIAAIALPDGLGELGSATTYQVTGYYVLLASLVASVVSDQWVCFALATLAIALALRLAIGKWSLALIALVPNTLPSLGILAGMGLIGMKMNLGAALIAAVSLGLSVDSSLHYLCQYRRRREETKSVHQSLLDCQSRVGVPLILSTATLVIGFGSLATSEFVPTIVFGTTAALCMLLGLVGNLWWLPVLVACFERDSD
jgi:predicted RND superfamily exporter protein